MTNHVYPDLLTFALPLGRKPLKAVERFQDALLYKKLFVTPLHIVLCKVHSAPSLAAEVHVPNNTHKSSLFFVASSVCSG